MQICSWDCEQPQQFFPKRIIIAHDGPVGIKKQGQHQGKMHGRKGCVMVLIYPGAKGMRIYGHFAEPVDDVRGRKLLGNGQGCNNNYLDYKKP